MNARAGEPRQNTKFLPNELKQEGTTPAPFIISESFGKFHLAAGMVGAGIFLILRWYWEAIKYELEME